MKIFSFYTWNPYPPNEEVKNKEVWYPYWPLAPITYVWSTSEILFYFTYNGQLANNQPGFQGNIEIKYFPKKVILWSRPMVRFQFKLFISGLLYEYDNFSTWSTQFFASEVAEVLSEGLGCSDDSLQLINKRKNNKNHNLRILRKIFESKNSSTDYISLHFWTWTDQ